MKKNTLILTVVSTSTLLSLAGFFSWKVPASDAGQGQERAASQKIDPKIGQQIQVLIEKDDVLGLDKILKSDPNIGINDSLNCDVSLLDASVMRESYGIVRYLIDHGADVNRVSFHGTSAFTWTDKLKNKEKMMDLLNAGRN